MSEISLTAQSSASRDGFIKPLYTDRLSEQRSMSSGFDPEQAAVRSRRR